MARKAVMVKMTAAEGKRDELVGALKPLLDAVQEEAGTLTYALFTGAADDSTVAFWELYSDEDAMKAHMASPAMAGVLGSLAGLVAGPPEMIQLQAVGGKGLDLG